MCSVADEARIETARLTLRPPRPDDAWRIADLANDLDVARMVTRISHPYGLADAEAFVQWTLEADPDHHRPFAVEHRDFGLIGLAGFHREDGAPLVEIGYWLGRTFWGRGFATEAARAALQWARDAWGRRAVASGHFADNPSSARVLDKAGFLYTGEVKPRLCLARGRPVDCRMMIWMA